MPSHNFVFKQIITNNNEKNIHGWPLKKSHKTTGKSASHYPLKRGKKMENDPTKEKRGERIAENGGTRGRRLAFALSIMQATVELY